ncbi:MAG: hypothetical protein M3275_10040, partial [Thermoproteota archaeon]|nr:hypothetical protein [Thermoproteota archaeon]
YYHNQAELPRQLDEQSNNKVDWLAFKDYLSKHYNHNTTKVRLCYAKRYYHVLLNEDASSLLVDIESQQKRLNAMKSLTLLARFLGCYDTSWQQLRKRHNLKWTTGEESLAAMQRFFDDKLTLDSMLQWVRQAIKVLPVVMALIIRHAVLTGLRPSEAVESVRLLNTTNSEIGKMAKVQYYNPERQTLEHFRFPEIFLRRTKKAYISFVSSDNYYQLIAQTGPRTPTLNAIRLTCRYRSINMNMHLCRRVFASWLRKDGIQPEVVDMLQGRVSQSVLTRHYLTPDSSLRQRVLGAISKLQKEIEK